MLRSIWVVIALSVMAPAQTPAPDKLPIKRVVLYKNGVGYFEHQGQVQGNQDVAISFTSGQLNDVLKSLTVLDLNGGRITGVNYGSSAPIDRQIGDLRLPIGQKTSLMEFLEAIRGARIEVKNGQQSLNGRLLSIERKTRIAGGNTSEVDFLSLITESGEVRTTELSPAFSVRLLERGLPDKVERYLDLASASREPDTGGCPSPPKGPASVRCSSATSAKFRSGKRPTASCSIPSKLKCRCSRDGRSSTTRLARIGRTSNCRWWRARRNRSSRTCRSRSTPGGPSCPCPKP